MSSLKKEPLVLPASLKRQLREMRSFLWKKRLLETLFWAFFLLLLGSLFVFIWDRQGGTPELVLTFLFGGLAVVGGLALVCVFAFLCGKRRKIKDLAPYIARLDASFGDRLLGVLELHESATGLHSHSLAQAALNQMAKDAEGKNFREWVSLRGYQSALALMLALFCFLIALFFLMPEASIASWWRYVSPLSGQERFTYMKLDGLRPELYVPLGEPFSFSVERARGAKSGENRLYVSLGEGIVRRRAILEKQVGRADRADLSFAGIFEPETLLVTCDDAHYRMEIIPVPRPAVAEVKAQVTYPSYTGRQQESVSIKTGVFPPLKGSQVILQAWATSPLSLAKVGRKGETLQSAALEGKEVELSRFEAQEAFEQVFSWEDTHGIASEKEFSLKIEPVEDALPEVYLSASSQNVYVLEEEIVPLELTSSDDYGLKEWGVTWQTKTKAEKKSLGQGTKTQRVANKTFFFRAKDWGISPQQLEIKAYGQDFYPERGPVFSQGVTLHILDRNAHAQMIRQQIDKVASQIEEVAQKEQVVWDEVGLLLEEQKETALSPEQKEKAQQLKESSSLQKDKTQQLSGELNKIFEKAMRNPQIPASLLAQYRKASDLLEALPEGSQSEQIQALDQSLSPTTSAEGQKEALKEAQKALQKTNETLSEALSQITQVGHKIEAGTFVARLQQIAREERQVGDLIAADLAQNIGLSFSELSPEARRHLEEEKHYQELLAKEIATFSDELYQFALRSKKEAYEAIAQRFTHLKARAHVEFILDGLSSNRGALASEEAFFLASQFEAWAKELSGEEEAPPAGQGDGEGGEQKPLSQRDIEFMIELLKTVQAEQDIRTRTREYNEFIQESGTEQKEKEGLLDALYQSQDNLQAHWQELQADYDNPKIEPLLKECQKAMNDVLDYLEQEETGGPTLAAESEVIEKIYEAAEQKANSPQASQGMKGLLMMMQSMMGKASGPAAPTPGKGGSSGENLSQGSKTSPTQEKGDSAPQKQSGRRVGKSTGSAGVEVSEEFRQEMENYARESVRDENESQQKLPAPQGEKQISPPQNDE